MRPYPSRLPSQAGASLSTLSMMPPAEARCELPRIPIPRTPVHKGLEPPSAGYMEPLWGRETLARKGANADERNADERASPKGSEQKHPRVGPRALLQQRDYLGGHGLPRRGGHLLRAQGQGQRHSALHLRADRRSEDSRGRGARRLPGVEKAQFRRIPLLGTRLNRGHEAGAGARGVRSDRCEDPVGTGGKPQPDHALSFASSRSLSAPLSVAAFSKAQVLSVRLEQPPVVLPGGLHETLTRGSPSAEGGHKRAVLAAQHHYVRVRLVQIVVELGEQWLILHAFSSQPRCQWLPALNAR